ncbi:hypothetical protein [Nostoc sp.]
MGLRGGYNQPQAIASFLRAIVDSTYTMPAAGYAYTKVMTGLSN